MIMIQSYGVLRQNEPTWGYRLHDHIADPDWHHPLHPSGLARLPWSSAAGCWWISSPS